jgi:ribosome-binding factor A
MPSALRQKRVSDRLLQEISGLLLGMNDPRLSLVTVTVVNIDRELEHANVFVSTVGDEARRKEVMQVLNGAKGYIRREVSHRVQLRRSPELIFHWDPSPEKAEQISQILDDLKSGGPAAPSPAPAPAPETKEAGDDQP